MSHSAQSMALRAAPAGIARCSAVRSRPRASGSRIEASAASTPLTVSS
jgi:hypothetical protein